MILAAAEAVLKIVRNLVVAILAPLAASAALAGPLPGFRLEKAAEVQGFITSLALRDGRQLYWSSATGEVYRLSGNVSEEVARFDTAVEGNAVLLGVTFRGSELFAHYVAKDFTADLIESVNLDSGERKEIARLVCHPGQPCPSEHHGGNLITAPDESIFFGIGDYGTLVGAQDPKSPAGKIYRIRPDNTLQPFAYGFRNPYDMVWDRTTGKLIVADNGPTGGDEVSFVGFGENHGWPLTYGSGKPAEGTVVPDYVFDETVAPTGMFLLDRNDPYLSRGLLLVTYWDKSLFWFDLENSRITAPVRLLDTGARENDGSHKVSPHHDVPLLGDALIDVVQDVDGTIYIATTSVIYKLLTPIIGDVDGNRKVDDADAVALAQEILDGGGHSYLDAPAGNYAASWGADVNRDRVINAADLVALAKLRAPRKRSVR